MTVKTDAPATKAPAPNADAAPTGPDARRNFIRQQGLCDPAAGASCRRLYAALLLQPWLIGLWVVVASVLQAPVAFIALAAVLGWSALIPRLNPFDALYNAVLAVRGARGMTLMPAPPPRRFAQSLAGSFALVIGVLLTWGWRRTALLIDALFLAAIAAVILGGFCFGSFVFHVIRGRAGFARRTLPWACGA